MRFRPMPGFTVLTLIMLAILISLGTWQYQRLQWKTDLLASIDAAADAAPFMSLSAVNTAIEDGDPVDFRRIEIVVTPIPAAGESKIATPVFFVFTTQDKKTYWRVFYPVSSHGNGVYVAGPLIPDAQKLAYKLPNDPQESVTGYVRLHQTPGFGSPKSTPSQNRYFSFNPVPDELDWGEAIPGRDIQTGYYIDAVPATRAENIPPKRPDIRNNHFDYMLTWYSFALILLVIYTIMHVRAGRLSFGGRS
ncbi:SURF1 family protein [Robiginitomaculum antarcticum]|uniref:SURF1 family protein n=1 Tax=Robiginitomaculum antarcticum TaxID=437507 RepID=UPI00037791F6|nr:SURF1 family cytochrome oxidase biogenesis protein [Robiginitomaculum antarcticum]